MFFKSIRIYYHIDILTMTYSNPVYEFDIKLEFQIKSYIHD